jgi:hypothetical protein
MLGQEPARAPLRVGWGLRDMVWAGLLAVALFVVGIIAVAVVMLVTLGPNLNREALTTPPRLVTLLALALEALLILPAWVFGPGRRGGGWRALGLRSFAPLKGLALLAGALVLILGVDALWEVARKQLGVAGQPNYLPLFGGGLQGLALALFLGGIVAPVAEEVFFRGYLYAGLRDRLGLGWGLVISGVIFALVHLVPGVLPPIFVMGVVFALLYQGTGSLWPCIILHGAINSLAFVALYLAA